MFKYERHEPKNTLLYKIINEYYPRYLSHLADDGRTLPQYIQREFDDYLRCGLLEYGFFPSIRKINIHYIFSRYLLLCRLGSFFL